ncbi:MAG: hypothetical protein LVR00_05540 [Rhabdochlamydiaceae bacterium]|jgi:hypothetical protein
MDIISSLTISRQINFKTVSHAAPLIIQAALSILGGLKGPLSPGLKGIATFVIPGISLLVLRSFSLPCRLITVACIVNFLFEQLNPKSENPDQHRGPNDLQVAPSIPPTTASLQEELKKALLDLGMAREENLQLLEKTRLKALTEEGSRQEIQSLRKQVVALGGQLPELTISNVIDQIHQKQEQLRAHHWSNSPFFKNLLTHYQVHYNPPQADVLQLTETAIGNHLNTNGQVKFSIPFANFHRNCLDALNLNKNPSEATLESERRFRLSAKFDPFPRCLTMISNGANPRFPSQRQVGNYILVNSTYGEITNFWKIVKNPYPEYGTSLQLNVCSQDDPDRFFLSISAASFAICNTGAHVPLESYPSSFQEFLKNDKAVRGIIDDYLYDTNFRYPFMFWGDGDREFCSTMDYLGLSACLFLPGTMTKTGSQLSEAVLVLGETCSTQIRKLLTPP